PTQTSGKIIGTEFIENTGIRGIENIAAKTSGVVQDEKGQNINIRGSRTGETQIVIDGVITNNPLDRGSTANVSNASLQELAVLTGGFSAEYGNILGGVINVTTKSAPNYTGSLEILSDVVAGDWINTTSQGYNVYSASLGGPIIPTKKLTKYWNLYGSYERNFFLVDQPISTDVAKLWFDDGVLKNFTREGHNWSGKSIISIDEMTKGKVKMNLTAGYFGNVENWRQWTGSFGLYNSFHNPRIEDQNHQGYLRINQSFGSKTFYDLQASYLYSYSKGGDGVFFIDGNYKDVDGVWSYPWYMAVGDTNVIPGLSAQGNTLSNSANHGVFRAPVDLSSISTFDAKLFGRKKTEQMSANLNFTHQLLTKKYGNHEFRIGGEFNQYKVRLFNVTPLVYSQMVYGNKYADS